MMPTAQEPCQPFQHDYAGTMAHGQWKCTKCEALLISSEIQVVDPKPIPDPNDSFYC